MDTGRNLEIMRTIYPLVAVNKAGYLAPALEELAGHLRSQGVRRAALLDNELTGPSDRARRVRAGLGGVLEVLVEAGPRLSEAVLEAEWDEQWTIRRTSSPEDEVVQKFR